LTPRDLTTAKRLFWLVAIWASSILAVGALAGVIKLAMNMAGLTVKH
jgi:Protein of unknown function (DUF2474)